MTIDPKNRGMDAREEPQADRWTRESFTFRRMTWTNIWLLLAGLVLLAIAVAIWMS